MRLSKTYDPHSVEEKIYRTWERSGFFNPDKLQKKGAKPFTIIMPPPNANGALHIGHALFVTLQDIIIRYKRMRGRKTLWLPGADHAGFETQVVFDKKLEKEGRSRFAIPRDKLYREMLEFTQANKKIMENQLRKLGASCDWSREKFTLDADIQDIVYDTFKRLWDDGLAYRGKRVINWCTKHQTSLSELEVKYREREDPLYYIQYGPLAVATVRPETKFGDTALAVNPNDRRYKKYIGKEIEARGLLGSLKLRVIADEAVDPAFGTGVVKVTPAHDAADFEMWQRHKDEIDGPKNVINEQGRLTGDTGPYHGLRVAEAREKVAEDMKKIGILQKMEEKYKHRIATCYKCGATLEPLPKPQWFIKTTEKSKSGGLSLRDAAVQAVKYGKIQFIPKRFEKLFFHWMRDLRDWNVSRQIIWGIRMPIWHCTTCAAKHKDERAYKFSKEPLSRCHDCGEKRGLKQDEDVFDTWFSSGQWPFAALGYPDSKDYKIFYPTDVMETGWDILFFWVSRMIMLGLYRTKKIPFRVVYLHGLVRDKDRQKISKSKDNVIDPLGVADLYGTDAVRMALVVGNTAGKDPAISEDKIRGYRNFANKIWNASRFLSMRVKTIPQNRKVKYGKNEKFMLKKLDKLIQDTTQDLEAFKFHHAAERLYHFFWHYYADKVIEHMKPRLDSEDGTAEKETAKALLLEFHGTLLKLLHPFLPFITEALYGALPVGERLPLMVSSWPRVKRRKP